MPKNEEIIKRLTHNLAEIITPEEFSERLTSGTPLTHYMGFEISGYVHIGQGIMTALVIKDLQELGVNCTIWLADWHSAINHKLDETKETAARIGTGYFTEALKACLLAVGADAENVEFRLASEWYAKDSMRYWELVMRVMQNTTLARLQRSISIMGKKEGHDVDGATLLYPAMQVADIFYQGIDIAHAGMDQRKAHVVMRDVAAQVLPQKPKPIAIHHPLLIGLSKPPVWPLPQDTKERDMITEMKMSKSKPDSAIWVHEEPADIQRKIQKAFCPEKEVQYNPILNWVGHLLFWNRTKPFRIERKPEHGGSVEFATYPDLEKAYAEGTIHPMDLKNAVAQELITLLEPVRAHFAKPDIAAHKAELDKVLQSK